MKLHIKSYNGDPTTLPHKEHIPGATPFNEFDVKEMRKFILTRGSILIILLCPYIVIHAKNLGLDMELGLLYSILAIFPRELIRALCFKEDVTIYINKKKLSLFVHGTESMSKSRFIMMNLLPIFILGVIPFILFVFLPQYTFFGLFGLVYIASGVGGYYNVINAIKQMPKGAKTYYHLMQSYWYLPI